MGGSNNSDDDYDDDDDDIFDGWNNDDFDAEDIFGEKRNGDDSDEVEMKFPAAEHVLVLLDCDPHMFTPEFPDENGDDDDEEVLISPMDATLKALEEYVRQQVRSNVTNRTGKRNGFGVRLFGTRERAPLRPMEEEEENNAKGNNREDSDDDEDTDDDDEEDLRRRARKSEKVTYHTLIPLEPPGVSTVKRLRQCLPNPYTGERELNVEQEFGHDKESDAEEYRREALKQALERVNGYFTEAKCYGKENAKANSKYAEDSKIIWIFTNQSDPCRGDEKDQELLRNCANDIRVAGCQLLVFPLCSPKSARPFDLENTIYNDIAEIPDNLHRATGALNLKDWMAGGWKGVRRSFFIQLLLPDYVADGVKRNNNNNNNNKDDDDDKEGEVKQNGDKDDTTKRDEDKKAKEEPSYPGIMLDFFRPFQRQYNPPKVKILRDMGAGGENVELERVTDIRVEETGEVLGKFRNSANKEEKLLEQQQPGLTRLRNFFELARELVPIQKQEIEELKRRVNTTNAFASLKLIGFKDKKSIPFHHNLEMPYFVYPNDQLVEGSRAAFAHLHRSMLKLNVVGIGELLVRKTATSFLVTMVPIEETFEEGDEEDEDGDAKVKNADEGDEKIQKFPPGWVVRVLPFEDEVRILDASNDAGFTNENFEDCVKKVKPKVKELVESMTLSEFTVGDDFKNQYIERFWDYVEGIALEDPSPLDDYRINPLDHEETLDSLSSLVNDVLRELPREVEKRKLEDVVIDENTDWEQIEGQLEELKLTNLQLKVGLKKYRCKVGGKKAELIERLREAINGAN